MEYIGKMDNNAHQIVKNFSKTFDSFLLLADGKIRAIKCLKVIMFTIVTSYKPKKVEILLSLPGGLAL